MINTRERILIRGPFRTHHTTTGIEELSTGGAVALFDEFVTPPCAPEARAPIVPAGLTLRRQPATIQVII